MNISACFFTGFPNGKVLYGATAPPLWVGISEYLYDDLLFEVGRFFDTSTGGREEF